MRGQNRVPVSPGDLYGMQQAHIYKSVYRSIDPVRAMSLIRLILYPDKLCVAVVNNYYRFVCLQYTLDNNSALKVRAIYPVSYKSFDAT